MKIKVNVEVKTRPGEYKTVTLTEDDLMRQAERQAEQDWACEPRAVAQSISLAAD